MMKFTASIILFASILIACDTPTPKPTEEVKGCEKRLPFMDRNRTKTILSATPAQLRACISQGGTTQSCFKKFLS